MRFFEAGFERLRGFAVLLGHRLRIFGIGLRDFGARCFEPGLQFRPELTGSLHFYRGEIVLFTGVLVQVVQLVAVRPPNNG